MLPSMQKSGKVVHCPGVDSDFTETEGCSEGSLQEQEVLAPRSASQENQSHPQTSHQASGIIQGILLYPLTLFLVSFRRGV